MRTKPYLVRVSIVLLWAVVGRAAADAPTGPNLLIIHTDEHHFNTLGCYGGQIVETPNIDWLAARGALCTSFYATTPVCSPSRSSFLSGRYPQHTPVVTNNIPLDDDIITFAEILRRQGYATGYAGKWHLDGGGKPQWQPQRAFGFEDNRFMFNRGHWKQFEDAASGPRVAARNAQGRPSYDVGGADERSFATDWLADKGVEFLREHRDGPFCYMISLPDPHGPNSVRPPYDTMYDDIEVPIPSTLHKTAEQTPKWGAPSRGVSEESLARIMPQYYGMVKCIDDNVGKLVETLRELDLLENTIVIFTADHGDLCGEHGRLNKGVPYEGSARIPFVIYYPHKIAPGAVVNQALSCVDFLPTILGLMGQATALEEEGRDASALFLGEATNEWDDVAFLRGTSAGRWLCVVTDRYKLIYSPQDEPWLFDLEQDPDELNNVFRRAENRDVVRRLTGRLMEYHRQYNDPYAEQPTVKAQMAAAVGR